LARVNKTPTARRPTSAATAREKVPTASRGRGRPPGAAASKSAGRVASAPSLGERVLALATGRTRAELYLACPNHPPKHIGIAVQRHLRGGRIQEREGKLYATSPQHSRRTPQTGLGPRRRPRACSTRARETSTRGERLRRACAAWPRRGRRAP